MREDIEQKSNEHHPVRGHWRGRDRGNSHPARCSSVISLLPHLAYSSVAAAPAQTEADQMGTCTKLAKLNRARNWSDSSSRDLSCPINFFPIPVILLSSGSTFQKNMYPKFLCSWSADSSSQTVSKRELCRIRTCVAAPQLSSQSWDQCA